MSETPVFPSAAVAAPHRLAAETGRAILAEGGNALEAMVAMAATVAVVYPHMNGIGGDGVWLVREPGGRVRALVACGPAGADATIGRYRDKGYDALPPRGPDAAITVAGAVGGWAAALALARAHRGRLPLDVLVSDAVGHARDGCPVSASEARFLAREVGALTPSPGFSETYLLDGTPPQAGALRRQPRLAETLAYLARAGLDDFYRGDVGRELAADLARIGSPVTRADLARYRAVERAPLALRLDGVTLYNSPPPTQGLASLIILGLFARLGVRGGESVAHHHGLIEAAKRAFAVRDRVVTDFDALKHDPATFLSEAVLAREAAAITIDRAADRVAPADAGDTVWMGAIDRNGLAVSYIQSVYWEYGSACVLPATGVCWQNRGTAFSLDPAATNPLTPGRHPFHTLNPPIAEFDDGRVMAYGSMGGDGQPQFQAQIFTRYHSFGMGVADAIDAPRLLYGRTWGAESLTVKAEDRFDPAVLAGLRRLGHAVEALDSPYIDSLGHAGMLVRHAGDGRVEAAHDPRSDGGAEGL